MLTLIQFNPDESKKPRTYRLAGDRAHLIGRRHGDVQLLDSRISRQHAEVSEQNGTWVIRDLSSSNGTWVNGDRIAGLCELEDGDRVVIGRITLIVGHVEADAPAEPTVTPAPALHDTAVLDLDSSGVETGEVNLDVASFEGPGAEAEPGDVSSLAMELDLDAELDLEAVELDFDARGAEAEDLLDDSVDSAAPITQANAAVGAADEIDVDESGEELGGGDLVDLSDTDGNASAHSDKSSLAPDPLLAKDDASSLAAEADEVQEHQEEDEYAAAVDFVTPTSRPDSPLDNAIRADESGAGIKLNAASPTENSADDLSDLDEADGAPAVVGLSLDLPAPDNEAADEQASASGEHEVEIDRSNAADLEQAALEAGLDAIAEDTGLDFELPEDSAMAAELEEEAGAVAVAASADASLSEASKSAPSADSDTASAEPDWVDSEAQQEIGSAWSGRGSSRKKGVAVLVLIALAAGGGIWAISSSDTNTPVAGVASDSETNTPASPMAGNDSPAVTEPLERVKPTPQPPAVAVGPTVIEPERNLGDEDRDIATSKSDAFGQAPTLTAPKPTPTIVEPAPVTPAPTRIETAQTEPVEMTPPPATATDLNTAITPDEPNDNAGPTLAMIDPTPVLNAGLLNLPDPPTNTPPAATIPGQRIAFVIDASGSMVDSMNQGALTWLERKLESLTDQDEFTVLFFRSNEVIEIPPQGMKSADSLARERALAWVAPDAGNIRPRGKSEPLTALQQAQQYQPTDIYILSDDKFGQGQAAADLVARDLEPLFRDNSPAVHTVQFFYPNPDDRPLETIAQRFGGTYEFVKEPPFELNPNSDIGVDLLGISR